MLRKEQQIDLIFQAEVYYRKKNHKKNLDEDKLIG